MSHIEKRRNYRILVIDDNESIHRDFRMILGDGEADTEKLDEMRAAIFGEQVRPESDIFTIDSAFQGEEGLERVIRAEDEGEPYVMAFVDVRMPPGWDGIRTIQRMWQEQPELQVVLCTAYSDYSWDDMIKELGQTDRLLVLKKPFDNIEVHQIVCALAEKWHLLNNLDQMVRQRTKEIAETRDVAVFALAQLAESRDPESGKHLRRIRSYCQILAEELCEHEPYRNEIDDQFVEDLYRSSPLHDIGKVGIPDRILLKPGTLSPDEFEVMKEHSEIGARSLEKTVRLATSGSFLSMATDIARYHHECYDGSGYPRGLEGETIPLAARIVALADVYDALTSVRVYKPAFRPEVAKLEIVEERGKHFDPGIVDAYLARQEEFLTVPEMIDSREEVVTGEPAI